MGRLDEFLTTCEQIAMLQNAGGAPKLINAYMMGWFAKQIVPQLTPRETEKLDAMPKAKRVRYLRKNHVAYDLF